MVISVALCVRSHVYPGAQILRQEQTRARPEHQEPGLAELSSGNVWKSKTSAGQNKEPHLAQTTDPGLIIDAILISLILNVWYKKFLFLLSLFTEKAVPVTWSLGGIKKQVWFLQHKHWPQSYRKLFSIKWRQNILRITRFWFVWRYSLKKYTKWK